MKYYIAIEEGGDNAAWGVVVPDLPGCFSAGDTLDEAMRNAADAIELHCEALIEEGQALPAGRPLDELRMAIPEHAGWTWALVDVPVEKYLGPAEKINITLPRLLLVQIDRYVRAHDESRSAFLARAAQSAMRDAG